MNKMQLRFTLWDGTEQIHRLVEGKIRLGRTSQNDLQIDELAISAQHCEFDVQKEKIIVRDIGSSSGTFLDGKLIEEAEVHSGQMLNLGSFSIHIESVTTSSKVDSHMMQNALSSPHRLSDGTYSCQSHLTHRASFECASCYTLFCEACFVKIIHSLDKIPCPRCDEILRPIDWSDMNRSREDRMMDLLPKGVKKAIDYWAKFRAWEKKRDI